MNLAKKFVLVFGLLVGLLPLLANDHSVFVTGQSDNNSQILAISNGQLVPLTEGPELHLFARVSGNGSWLAYSEGVDPAHLKIVIRNLGTGEEEEWTPAEGYLQPSLSWDGAVLAFSGPLKEGGVGIQWINLYQERLIAPFVQGNQKRKRYLAPRIQSLKEPGTYFPQLSRDGAFLVYEKMWSSTEKQVLWRSQVTGEVKELTPRGKYFMAPCLSLDGQKVVFSGKENGQLDIYETELETGNRERLTQDAYRDVDPTYDTLGSVIFSSDRAGEGTLGLFQILKKTFEHGKPKVIPYFSSPGWMLFLATFSELL